MVPHSPRHRPQGGLGRPPGVPSKRINGGWAFERIARTVFLHGYHAALEGIGPICWYAGWRRSRTRTAGFAFEGAAMGLCLLDHLAPWRRDRLEAFLAGPGRLMFT